MPSPSMAHSDEGDQTTDVDDDIDVENSDHGTGDTHKSIESPSAVKIESEGMGKRATTGDSLAQDQLAPPASGRNRSPRSSPFLPE